MMANIPIIHVNVPGNSVYGKISRTNHFEGGRVLVLKSLELGHYQMVMNSIGIVCENCQKTSHIIVVCRIMGIPVVTIQSVNDINTNNEFIHINFQDGQIQYSDQMFAITDKPVEYHNLYPKLFHQLSIVNSCNLISRINEYSNDDVEQIFLRSELLWLSFQTNPYEYFYQYGKEATVSKIYNQLSMLYINLKDSQILNFRGLDLRSDQGLFENSIQKTEPNPHLGMHGTRQLLQNPGYLITELKAVDYLYSQGYNRVVYSLPFVISKYEMDEVIHLRNQHCKYKIDLGVFVETPAAVVEVENIITDEVRYAYIGTKDLSQLILAVDRDNSDVSHLMDLVSPPVIKAIRYTIKICNQKKVPVYVFSMPTEISRLLEMVPEIKRISIPAADYFKHKEGCATYANI
jgi:phosphoenolpyruvate-protein kinase (PTS system EI component)